MCSANLELDYIVVEPKSKPCDTTIIWLHGLGADGNDFVGIVNQLGLPASNKVKFIFPHAPHRAITINNGMTMRGWYDLYDMKLNNREDIVGITQSQQAIIALIEKEVANGVSYKRIILAGFSQGGAMALYTGLRMDFPIGGIIALSTYQVLANTLEQERSDANQNVPIFMAHGVFDSIVPFAVGKMSYKQMHKLSYQIQWKDYPMEHSVIPEEIQHIGEFINRVVYESNH
jgi:phospholipase/carboxylesterase